MTTKIKGVEEVVGKLTRLPKKLQEKDGRKIIRAALEPIYHGAVLATPVWSGRLASSWRIRTTFDEKRQAAGTVMNPTYYGLFQEAGHKIVKRVRLDAPRRKRRGNYARIVIGFRPGKKMLEKSYEANKERAVEIAAQMLSAALDKEVKK